jgi:trehalose-6-phosphate synthase
VIVLSENAGAHEELRGNVLSINPFDVVATADAMYAGLVMASEERHRMNDAAREVVRANDIARWISNQVQDLRDLVAPGKSPRHLELHVPAPEPRERRAGGEDRRRLDR